MKNSQKPKDLPLKELIKDISSKGVDHLTIQVLFDLLLKIAIEYTDYYESDLGEFLFTKLFKKFYIYISLRILIIIGYLTSLSLFIFLDPSLLSVISGFISFPLFFAFIYVDKTASRRYKYTTSFFYKTGKKLILFRHKLDLILNNSYLSDNYTEPDFDLERIKTEYNKLKNRINNNTIMIKSYSYYLKKYALPSILFAPIITFFINLIYELIQNPILINLDAITDFILGLGILSLLLYQNLNSLVKVRKSRRFKEASVYVFYEYMAIMILEAIRLNIRIQQFPKEEKLKKGLIHVMKNIGENLKMNNLQD